MAPTQVVLTSSISPGDFGYVSVLMPTLEIDGVMYPSQTLRQTYDDDGTLSMTVNATDDTGVNPEGAYAIISMRNGMSRRSFKTVIPNDASPIDLDTLIPADIDRPGFVWHGGGGGGGGGGTDGLWIDFGDPMFGGNLDDPDFDWASTINLAVNYSQTMKAAGVNAPWKLTPFKIGSTRVNLKNQAFKGISMEHTRFDPTHLNAGIDFSMDATPGDYGYGNINGSFHVYNTVANRPLRIGPRTMNRFESIRVTMSMNTDDSVAMLLYSTQNSLFTNINLFGGLTTLRLDGGTANNHFLKGEIAGGNEHHIEFRNDLTPFPGQLNYCFDNVFESTILEWTEQTTDALIYSTCGAYNTFLHCPLFVNGHIGGGIHLPTDMDYAVKLELTEGAFNTMQIIDCTMTGYSAVQEGFIGVGANCEVLLSGGTMQRATRGVHGAGLCNMGVECRFLATVTTRYAVFAFSDHRGINRYYGTTGTDLMQRFRVEGEAADRHYIDTNGAHYWGNGTDAVDTNLYRNGAATLTVTGSLGATGALVATGKVTANAGLGVGNSAAATTPGTVVRKMEVFAANGTSLGFVPIYNTIT